MNRTPFYRKYSAKFGTTHQHIHVSKNLLRACRLHVAQKLTSRLRLLPSALHAAKHD